MTTEATKYIRAIRNVNKQAYAMAYQRWLDGGENGPAPERSFALGAMAAQAVRINLHNCLHLDKKAA